MKKIVLNKYNVFIAFLLSMLGLGVSCDVGGKAMYGTPSATFKVLGKVTTESNIPIEGIQVIMFPDSTYTNAEGNYEVTLSDFPKNQSFVVNFKDIDGPNNGSYLQKDSTVNFVDNQYQNGSGWNSGEVSKTVDIKLKEE